MFDYLSYIYIQACTSKAITNASNIRTNPIKSIKRTFRALLAPSYQISKIESTALV